MINSRLQITIRQTHWLFGAIAAAIVSFCAPAALGQDTFDLNEDTFNQWLYNASQGQFDPHSEVQLAVEAVDRACGLTDPQLDKLRLAGQGDYARFEQRAAELREKYVGKTYSQNDVGNIYQKIQPLAQIYQAGLLGDSSLFSKVMIRTLSREQIAEFELVEHERRQASYAAKVGLFITTLERSCPLTDEQRTALEKLILSETRPPKVFGQYDWYVIMFQASQIPDEKYTQFLDEPQLKVFRQAVQQGAGLGQWLRQQKILAAE